jgi:cytochrome c5
VTCSFGGCHSIHLSYGRVRFKKCRRALRERREYECIILRASFFSPIRGVVVSKQDTHFFNMFSLVLGILIGLAILFFVVARLVGSATQAQQVQSDEMRVAAVDERTRPLARVAVAGQNNAALNISEPSANAGGAAPGLPVPKSAEQLYNSTCVACHGQGIGGAPKFGDHAAWAPRIAQGKDVLYKHALGGFQGTSGLMPPKGGRIDLPDDLIRSGVDYMVSHSR